MNKIHTNGVVVAKSDDNLSNRAFTQVRQPGGVVTTMSRSAYESALTKAKAVLTANTRK